jgi:m7GpppX diphosphatase
MKSLESLTVLVNSGDKLVCTGKVPSGETVLLTLRPAFPKDEENVLAMVQSLDVTAADVNARFFNALEGKISCAVDSVSGQLTFPAKGWDVSKAIPAKHVLVRETFAIYADPEGLIQKYQLRQTAPEKLEWVYNALDGKKEQELVVSRDEEIHLSKHPDWAKSDNPEEMYLLAMPMQRGVRSLRDITAEHLPMLRALRSRVTAALSDGSAAFEGVLPHHVQCYFHYPPSYYHLHVHCVHLKRTYSGAMSNQIGHAHLLDDVIANVEAQSDFYQRATLSLAIKETHPYAKAILAANAAISVA